MDGTSLVSEECFRDLPPKFDSSAEFAGFAPGRFRSVIILVLPIRGKVEQESSTSLLSMSAIYLFLPRCSWLCNAVNWPLTVKQKQQA